MKNRGFAALMLTGILHAIAMVVIAPRLPDQVPTHFGAGREADAWSSRSEALWMFGLIGGGTLLVFLLMTLFMHKVPPSLVNVPNKDWWTATPERITLMHDRMKSDMNILGAATVLLMTLIMVDTARAANTSDPQLGWIAVAGLIAYLFFTLGFVIWMFTHRFARGDE